MPKNPRADEQINLAVEQVLRRSLSIGIGICRNALERDLTRRV